MPYCLSMIPMSSTQGTSTRSRGICTERTASPTSQPQVGVGALLAFEQIRRFLRGDIAGRLPINGNDAVTGANVRPLRGSAGYDFYDQQGVVGGFQFNSQADKVAFDLIIHIVQFRRP